MPAGMPNIAGRELIIAALQERPNVPILTLAKELYSLNPGVWATVETARRGIAYYVGAVGAKHRASGSTKELHRAPRQSGDDWWKHIPDAWEEPEPWGPFPIAYPNDAILLSDFQNPFHDKKACRLAIDSGRDRGVGVVVLNGDFVDDYWQSDFVKDPRYRDFPEEVKSGVAMLSAIRKAFPDASIILKHGNHEERYYRYMMVKAPILLGVKNFSWESTYQTEDLGIEVVQHKRPLRFGKIDILHGHEVPMGGVFPAKRLYDKYSDNAIAGHVHRSSQYSRSHASNGKIISTWTTGCLCGLHPDFARINEWNQGFAIVSVDENGAFEVENKRIIDGKVW